MPSPNMPALWRDWVKLLSRRHRIDPRRDECGNPYPFNSYEFQPIDRGEALLREGRLELAAHAFRLALTGAARTRTPTARLIKSEALMSLGEIAWERNHREEAWDYYQQATDLLRAMQAKHDLGIAVFRLAILSEERGQLECAREYYSETCLIWKRLEQENGQRGNWNRRRRYGDERRQIEAKIIDLLSRSVEQEQLVMQHPEIIERAGEHAKNERIWTEEKVQDLEFTWRQEGFQEIPILETEVAAGDPVAVGEDRALGHIFAGTVVFVGDEQYLPISLVDESNYLNLNPESRYGVLRVDGKSMDHASPVPIEANALVVIERPKEKVFGPIHGSIIAAILPEGPNHRIMLQRFYRIGLEIHLESETSSPESREFQPRIYPSVGRNDPSPFQFAGEAIAVLKPIGVAESETDSPSLDDLTSASAPFPTSTDPRHIMQEQRFVEIPVLQSELGVDGTDIVREGRTKDRILAGCIVLIEDEQYAPLSLLGESHYLNLYSEFTYSAVRVRGNSMDSANPFGIHDKEMVILRHPKKGTCKPVNGEIVAAVLPDIGMERAILKRYSQIGNTIHLVSETSEPNLPEHQVRVFRNSQSEELPVRFVAQAIAVLKPM